LNFDDEAPVVAGPRRRARPPRRPERQQILIRRGIALGAGLIVLILVVLGVKGCLDARKDRALTDYARNVTQIVDETQQTSKMFFGKLTDPGNLSVTEFTTEVNADRSAMDNYRARVDSLSAPGDMGHAQNALELVYELRASAMTRIANSMSTALGSAGVARADAVIAAQMQKLLASDVLYAAVVKPEIDGVLASNGIDGNDVPASAFLPDTSWLDPDTIGSALGVVSDASPTTTGVHGLGLMGTRVNNTALTAGASTTVSAGSTPEVEVQVQNQGDSTENGVTVSVEVNGHTLEGTISAIAPQETQTATIPLTPAPSGQVTLNVDVHTVPGEKISSNNKASYTVDFQ
jgi:hypothetical protein